MGSVGGSHGQRRHGEIVPATALGVGGLLIAPAYDVEPEVPWENIKAFLEAVEEC